MMSTDPIRYLNSHIRKSAIDDIRDVAHYHAIRRKSKPKAGHFSIPRNVFCFVDHLGAIAFGGSSSLNAVKFIQTFFPPEYHDFAALTYCMWRHGTVHEYKPKSYYATVRGTEIEVRWLTSIHNRKAERSQNMLSFPMKRKKNILYLVVNTCQLVDDLIDALDEFVKHFRKDPSWKQQCAKQIAELAKPKKSSSVGVTMAAQVQHAIENAWKNQRATHSPADNIACGATG